MADGPQSAPGVCGEPAVTDHACNLRVHSAADEHGIAIGRRRLSSRYFLAPLAGYTQLSFRTAMRELGGLGLATTDLVLATHLIGESRKSQDLVSTTPADRPLTVQIFSGETWALVAAARWLEDRGYEAIDINMGCPMAKITGQGGGARLMCNPQSARETVRAVIAATRLPVTVKMRLGWDRQHLLAPELARQFEEEGVAAVTIHGRTRQQGFSGRVDLDGIAAVVAAVRQMPVIGNGDVLSVDDAIAMRLRTGCQAVAIGRGAMLDPWLFRKIDQRVRGEPETEPTPAEQLQFLRRHFALLCEQHPERAMILFRKFAAWYGARLGIPEELEDELRQLASEAHFEDLVQRIRDRQGTRVNPIPTALIRTPNGPVEHW